MAGLSRCYVHRHANLGKHQSPPASVSRSNIDGGGGTTSPFKPLHRCHPFPSCPHLPDGRTGQFVDGSGHLSESSCSFLTAATAPVPREVPHVDRSPARVCYGFIPDDETLTTLQNFRYNAPVRNGGMLEVRPLESREDMDAAAKLLVMSFSDAWWRSTQRKTHFLELRVQQHMERIKLQRPHATTLVGFYRVEKVAKPQLAGTAEVWFEEKESSSDLPAPVPPPGTPYICNMTVNEKLRRMRIGWHLLQACERLTLKMCRPSTERVYLHCRVKNKAAREMYEKAGYIVVDTDSNKLCAKVRDQNHLMCKKFQIGYIEFD